jgi:hypothetical protein
MMFTIKPVHARRPGVMHHTCSRISGSCSAYEGQKHGPTRTGTRTIHPASCSQNQKNSLIAAVMQSIVRQTPLSSSKPLAAKPHLGGFVFMRVFAYRFVSIISLAIVCVGLAAAQEGATSTCTDAELSGVYGAALSGTTNNGVLVGAGGQLKFNGTGKVSGSWSTNTPSGVVVATVTGTYSISPTCFGTMTLTPKGGASITFNIAVDSTQRIELIVTNAGFSEVGYALAQGKPTCTKGGLVGTWSWNSLGLGAGFIAQTALAANGTLSGWSTITVNGDVQSNLPTGGTVTIRSNCTGTVTFTLNGQKQGTGNFVVVNGGQELLLTNSVGAFITALRD